MSVIEIIHTHPFAAGIAGGVVLTFCCFVLCAVFLYSLEKTKALARESAKATSGVLRNKASFPSHFAEPDSFHDA